MVKRRMSGSTWWAGTLFILVACSADHEVAGSCQSAQLDDSSVICIDYLDASGREQWRSACETAMRGKWSPVACETTNALGGCQAGNKIIWMYVSETHRSVQDAEKSCAAKSRPFLPVSND